MPHINQTVLGITILLLLQGLLIVKRLATGSIFDKPGGSFLVRGVNSFNLFFLLAVNPLAAILMITHQVGIVDTARIPVPAQWLLAAVEITGLAIYMLGYALMAWALIRLGGNYQLGGSAPRAGDALVMSGPYRWVRHPMYTAALGICLGLAFLAQSWALLGVFCIYLVLIRRLIPVEEQGLRQAYGATYVAYQKKTHRLFPVAWAARPATFETGGSI